MRQRPEQADREEDREIPPARRDPADGRDRQGQQRHHEAGIEQQRERRLLGAQLARDHADQRVADRADDAGRIGQDLAAAELRTDYDSDADEAEHDRRQRPLRCLLTQNQRGQHGHRQRHHVEDRIGVGERQTAEGEEERAARHQQQRAAQDMHAQAVGTQGMGLGEGRSRAHRHQRDEAAQQDDLRDAETRGEELDHGVLDDEDDHRQHHERRATHHRHHQSSHSNANFRNVARAGLPDRIAGCNIASSRDAALSRKDTP